MNIQSNINQSLSLLGLLASQTPQAAVVKEKAAEKQRIKDLQKNVGKAEAASKEVLEGYDDTTTPHAMAAADELFTSSLEKEISAKEELFYADPTVEGGWSIVRGKAALAGFKEGLQDIATEKANKALADEQKRIADSNARTKILEGTPAHTTEYLAKEKEKKARLGGNK